MKDYQERVVAEKQELDSKLARLEAFLSVDAPAWPEAAELALLQRQLEAMRVYSSILQERIARWKL